MRPPGHPAGAAEREPSVRLLRTELDLGWLRLHDLRHARVTYLLSAAVEPRVVMDILGHSTIRLTMDTYGHVLPERLRSAADAMDWTLRQGGQGA